MICDKFLTQARGFNAILYNMCISSRGIKVIHKCVDSLFNACIFIHYDYP